MCVCWCVCIPSRHWTMRDARSALVQQMWTATTQTVLRLLSRPPTIDFGLDF
jgi:hypothetical protein